MIDWRNDYDSNTHGAMRLAAAEIARRSLAEMTRKRKKDC